MSSQLPWPGQGDPIVAIEFELMIVFDEEGQPQYTGGRVASREEVNAVTEILAPLQATPMSITSVVMGKVRLELASGATIEIRPVFHPSLDAYQGLFKVNNLQYPMPDAFAALLEEWRHRSPGEARDP
ncbi:MAG: hypothetical protein GY722_29275 [bacterium]|nr:hypothetical protein [bacterium]